MMRSESRTEETSGLVTMTASSAIAHGERGAAFDAGRAVAQDPVEPAPELGDDAADALVGQRVLVPRLRGRQQPEIFQPLVADQRLRQLGDALHHVDEVEHHAAFGAHHEVEVAQADVEIDHHDVLPALRKRRAERGRRGGLSNASLA